jgi:NitT/TauT family transport system substrate-binding protein
MKNTVILDTRSLDWQMGVVAFRDKEMQRQARREQFDLFVKAYNQACDSINKYGLKHYRELIIKRCKIRKELVDSLPQDMKFAHAKGPRQQDIDIVEKWLGKK